MRDAPRPWIDISRAIHPDMPVWPGDPETQITTTKPTAAHPYQSSALSMSLHAGTHLDAPRHVLPEGPGIDAFPLELCIGPAQLIDCRGLAQINEDDLRRRLGRHRLERVLLRTKPPKDDAARGNIVDYSALTEDAARYLVERGCRLVGTDAASIGAPDEVGAQVHRLLLGAGLWVLEGLVLDAAIPGPVELLCAPLIVQDADGAPVRALLRAAE